MLLILVEQVNLRTNEINFIANPAQLVTLLQVVGSNIYAPPREGAQILRTVLPILKLRNRRLANLCTSTLDPANCSSGGNVQKVDATPELPSTLV